MKKGSYNFIHFRSSLGKKRLDYYCIFNAISGCLHNVIVTICKTYPTRSSATIPGTELWATKYLPALGCGPQARVCVWRPLAACFWMSYCSWGWHFCTGRGQQHCTLLGQESMSREREQNTEQSHPLPRGFTDYFSDRFCLTSSLEIVQSSFTLNLYYLNLAV